jgi:type IV secretion system protein VirB10
MAGTVIPAALVTGINSDLPGVILASVTEPVYDTKLGRYLLVPQGTRLIGQYDSQVAFGQRRVLLVWNRLIFPDASSLTLDRLPGVDTAGNAGLEDGVDRHWRQLLAGAALSTLIGVAAEIASPDRNSNEVVVSARQSVQESINQVGQELTRRNLNVQPTLTIRPGYPVRVIVSRDLVLRPYQPLFVQRSEP